MGQSGEAVGRAGRLGDPRRYTSGGAANPLLSLGSRGELVAALRELAAAGRDADIAALLASAASAPDYARVWHALCAAVEQPHGDSAIVTRVFAMPWVIVCGASAAVRMPCVLGDAAGLARVLEENGAFGASRNLGLGSALVSIETLEALRPSEVLQAPRASAVRELPPDPIDLTRGAEAVHVRFLLGAAVAPSHAPGVVETAANIAAWGTPALRAMAAQLAMPGLQVLPMPRPPAGLYTAAWLGRRAGVEAAFNLFISNAVRRFRMAVGEPHVTLSSHACGELRVTLSSALDESLTEGFRWPLHPADDLDEVEETIAAMLWECRLPEPRYLEGVLPHATGTGAILFPVG